MGILSFISSLFRASKATSQSISHIRETRKMANGSGNGEFNSLFNVAKDRSRPNSQVSHTRETSIMTIDNVINSEFSEYLIKRDVDPKLLGIQIECKPFSYAFYKDNRLKAIVMLVDHNRDRNRAYLNAKSVCESNNVPFINFYTHMYNERQYVLDRIKNKIA